MEKRFVDIKAFMEYTGLGRNKAMEFGTVCGCRVKIGRRTLYDLKRADAYMDKMSS